MNSTWIIKYKGELLPRFELESIKQKFARNFGHTDKKVEHIFSGRKITLKNNCLDLEAQKYLLAINKLGMYAHIDMATPEKPAITPNVSHVHNTYRQKRRKVKINTGNKRV